MHEIQKILLKRLKDKNGQKYATLTRGYDFEDNVVFHLKQLMTNSYIEKSSGVYSITAAGIKEITQYDLTDLAETGFKTFFMGFLINFKDKFLIKSHPQGITNLYNLPSGKPVFGERMEKALVNNLVKISGLNINAERIKFKSLHLKTVKTSAGEVLFDDAFAIYEIILTKQEYKISKPGENISWMTIDEIKLLPNRWPELDIFILKKSNDPYLVYEFISDYILD